MTDLFDNEDLLFEVFTHMAAKELLKCAQVNSRWKKVASKDSLWKRHIDEGQERDSTVSAKDFFLRSRRREEALAAALSDQTFTAEGKYRLRQKQIQFLIKKGRLDITKAAALSIEEMNNLNEAALYPLLQHNLLTISEIMALKVSERENLSDQRLHSFLIEKKILVTDVKPLKNTQRHELFRRLSATSVTTHAP